MDTSTSSTTAPPLLCPRCRYSLAGLEEEPACPECGLSIVEIRECQFPGKSLPYLATLEDSARQSANVLNAIAVIGAVTAAFIFIAGWIRFEIVIVASASLVAAAWFYLSRVQVPLLAWHARWTNQRGTTAFERAGSQAASVTAGCLACAACCGILGEIVSFAGPTWPFRFRILGVAAGVASMVSSLIHIVYTARVLSDCYKSLDERVAQNRVRAFGAAWCALWILACLTAFAGIGLLLGAICLTMVASAMMQVARRIGTEVVLAHRAIDDARRT
jgi:hypothetical protein